ncbi:MAG: hypothetical protein IT438_15650 [Phycisphaerales bacterium]|nr:hypothetical protein [Phycisphaerales bacterium]
MKLDSARGLKSSLIDKLVKGSLLPATTIKSLGATIASFAAAPTSRATLALGITRKGKTEYRLAVRLQQRSLDSDRFVAAIRAQAGREADVCYIGRVHPMSTPWHFKRQRPLLIGASVGHFDVTAGTIGCFVRGSNGKLMILSNNHVLANEGDAKKGDAVIQPGDLDGGRPATGTVAALTRFVKFKWNGDNFVDAAVATVNAGITADRGKLKGLGTLAGTEPVELDIGEAVCKVGRTTGVTRGRVSSIELDNVFVDYDNGRASFDNQLEIEPTTSKPFSRGGDSGSLIVTADLRPAALLFAGSDHGGPNDLGVTFANPIKRVLKDLKVKIAI